MEQLEVDNTEFKDKQLISENEPKMKKTKVKINKTIFNNNNILFLFLSSSILLILFIFLLCSSPLSFLNSQNENFDNSKDLSFKFKAGKSIEISKDGKTASKINNYAWFSAIGDKILEKNKKSKWKIKVNKNLDLQNNGVRIGISRANINLESLDNYKEGWFLSSSDSRFHRLGAGFVFGKYGKSDPWKEGTVIEVRVDLIKGQLSFIVNGEDLGVACKTIPLDEDLVPFIELHSKEKNEVEILN